jgi:hypothetical protein
MTERNDEDERGGVIGVAFPLISCGRLRHVPRMRA